MHRIFHTRHHSWRSVEDAIAKLPTTTELGSAFEQFAAFYFKYFARLYNLTDVQFPKETGSGLPAQIVKRLGLGPTDYGIDGVCTTASAQVIAVQVKFRTGRESISFRDLATFWSEAHAAEQKMVFTNSREITRVSERRPGHVEITLAQLVSLEEDFFDALYAYARESARALKVERKSPRPYQQSALRDILRGFESQDRGKLIAACGIGKTLVALWAAEQLGTTTVLFLAPNLQLIRQTLTEWSVQADTRFDYIAVCSDTTVADELDELEGHASESDVPTTTDPSVIRAFLSLESDRKVVFSTYQSLPMVVRALRGLKGFAFDLSIFDEAHKTAGAGKSTGFTLGLDDRRVPSTKRLFMTATERLYGPRALSQAASVGVPLFSMDDEAVYGTAFHRITFSEAIREEIICDYQVVLVAVTQSEFRNVLLTSGLIVDEDDTASDAIRTDVLLTALVLTKAFPELDIHKVVSYHRSVADARALAEFPLSPVVGLHVNGSMSGGERAQRISEFEQTENAILTNARCLVEGVDIPLIDGVCFASPKSSLIDIVQAVGRALRQPWGAGRDKVAKIIVPALVGDDPVGTGLADEQFEGLYNVIQALRDQDESLAQVIDDMNLNVSRGQRPVPAGGSQVVSVMSIGHVSVAELTNALELRIAAVNSRPGHDSTPARVLGAGERGSAPRGIRTLADYTPAAFEASLAEPTMERFEEESAVCSRDELRVNNNNVGHCVKLGLIKQLPTKRFVLTSIGKDYWSGATEFDDVLRNQILIYRDPQSGRYPYRLVLEFVQGIERMTYWDFLFGIYGSSSVEPDDEIISNALKRASSIAGYAASNAVANDKSKQKLTDELNAVTGLAFMHNDIWTDRTTSGNQFRYFLRHLELFGRIFDPQARELILSDQHGRQKIADVLTRSSRGLGAEQYGEHWWL